jgi:hypothetical protein
MGLHSSGSGYGQVAGCIEYGNESCIKYKVFLDQLSVPLASQGALCSMELAGSIRLIYYICFLFHM